MRHFRDAIMCRRRMRTALPYGCLLTVLLGRAALAAPPCPAAADRLVTVDYPDRGTVWIPAEAACGGHFPLLVLMHGQNPDHREAPLVGGGLHLETVVRRLIDDHLIRPIVLAAPVHLEGATSRIYGPAFDPKHHLELVMAELRPLGIELESVSYVGHSASGCHHRGGLHKVLTHLEELVPALAPRLLLWGTADTCYRVPYHWELPRQVLPGKHVVLVNVQSVQDDAEVAHYEKALMPKARPLACPKSFRSCVADPVEAWCSYRTKGVRHADNPVVYVREVLPKVFAVDPDVKPCR
jgi:hypothetical protein